MYFVLECLNVWGRSMTVMEEEGERASVEQDRILSTETEDLGAIPSKSQSVLSQDSLAEQLGTPITNVFYDASAKSMEVLDDASIGENSRNDEFE